jgi:hypothetical protein
MEHEKMISYIEQQIRNKQIDHIYIKNFLDTYNLKYIENGNGVYFNISKIKSNYIQILYNLLININKESKNTYKTKQEIKKICETYNQNTNKQRNETIYKKINIKFTDTELLIINSSLHNLY